MTTRQTIEGYFSALKAKARWQDALATDMVFTSHVSPVKQVAGRDAYLEATKRFYSTIADFEVHQLLVDGDRAVALTQTRSSRRTVHRPSRATSPNRSRCETARSRRSISTSTARRSRSSAALRRRPNSVSLRHVAAHPQPPRRVVVIGAGAAGSMAAIFAAKAGAETTLLERTRDGGRKILISGGGRCNVLPMRVDESRFVTDSSPNLLRKMLRVVAAGRADRVLRERAATAARRGSRNRRSCFRCRTRRATFATDCSRTRRAPARRCA